MLIQRQVSSIVQSALNRQAAVALIGPRQVGKTTLARMIGAPRNALYLDLEDREDRDKLASPRLYLDRFEERLVILDEIHRMPELFQTLRGIIEIKRGLAAKLERGFHHARQDLAPAKSFVVYSGEERYPVADGVEAIIVREMAAVLASL